jgi:hypothetical protein
MRLAAIVKGTLVDKTNVSRALTEVDLKINGARYRTFTNYKANLSFMGISLAQHLWKLWVQFKTLLLLLTAKS